MSKTKRARYTLEFKLEAVPLANWLRELRKVAAIKGSYRSGMPQVW
ncbi:hypothetical protein [Burkholderia sp. Bp9140]|nr:hypothetical protein [Burkholderia sp. Bp9140]